MVPRSEKHLETMSAAMTVRMMAVASDCLVHTSVARWELKSASRWEKTLGKVSETQRHTKVKHSDENWEPALALLMVQEWDCLECTSEKLREIPLAAVTAQTKAQKRDGPWETQRELESDCRDCT